jgi:cytochrome c biogenesis protein
MKNARPGLGLKLWNAWSSTRMSRVWMSGMLGVFALALIIAQERVSAQPLAELYSPRTLYWLRSLGFTDVFHSGWFIFVMIGAVLNLLCITIHRLPGIWRRWNQKVPEAIELTALKQKKCPEPVIYVELPSTVGREEFRESVMAWCKRRFGRSVTLRDEGGLNELQLTAGSGRLALWALPLGFAGILVLVAGFTLGRSDAYRAELLLAEKGTSDRVKLVQGTAPDWPPLQELGREFEGFYRPDFTLRLDHYDPEQQVAHITYSRGKQVESHELSRGHPLRLPGFVLREAEAAPTGKFGVELIVQERDLKQGPEHLSLDAGESRELKQGKVRILDVRDELEGLGAAAQVEFTPKKGIAEKFWVFQNYPNYDRAHRKDSPLTFALDSVTPRFDLRLELSRDSSLPWVACGLALI